MNTMVTLLLYAGRSSSGSPVRESLEAEETSSERYVLSVTPLLALGVAEGDEIRLVDQALGTFVVERRSGNLAIQSFAKEFSSAMERSLTARVIRLGGRVGLRSPKGMSASVPVSRGFSTIEAELDAFCQEHPGTEWYFGNVYDPKDGVTPLNWW